MSAKPTDTVLDAVDPTTCALYTPGHNVHFIQAKLGWETDPATYRHGTVICVQSDGWITVEVDGEPLAFWTHDPARARECFQRSAGIVELPGYSLLHAPHAGGRYCICVSTDGPTPCAAPSPIDLTPAGLLSRIRSHGGFLIPAEALRDWPDEEDAHAGQPSPHSEANTSERGVTLVKSVTQPIRGGLHGRSSK